MAEAPTTGKKNEISVVAEDKNWRDNVRNELNFANKWQADWGFLSGGALESKLFLLFTTHFAFL